MKRNEAVGKLRRYAGRLRSLGATSLFLFGSTAKNKATRRSDIDLFVDYDPKKLTLMELVGIKQLLENELGVEVDVTTRDSLHPLLRDEIEQSAIRVF